MWKKLITLVIALSTLSGCIEMKNEIKVNKDGSGSITVQNLVNPAIGNMMNMGGADQPKPNPEEDIKKKMLDKDKLKAQAKAAGVVFKEATFVKNKNGFMGAKVTYTFPDITKVDIGKLMDNEGGGKGAMKYEFKFQKGAHPKLTVINKAEKKKGGKVKSDQEIQQAMGMMQMMSGLKMRVLVSVDGEIVSTNAKYKKGSKVLLAYLDLDKIKAKPDNLKKMLSIPDGDTDALEKAGIEGIKFEPSKEVTITFK